MTGRKRTGGECKRQIEREGYEDLISGYLFRGKEKLFINCGTQRD